MRIPTSLRGLGAGFVIFVFTLSLGCSQKAKRSTTVTPEQEAAFTNVAERAIIEYGFLSSDRHATMRTMYVAGKLNEAGSTKYVADVIMARPMLVGMAVPQTRIVLTDTLVNTLKTDDELAWIIAHQMGHLSAGHPLQKLKTVEVSKGTTGSLVLANWNPGSTDPAVQAELNNLASKLWDLRYSADEERVASARAAQLLAKAGYRADAPGLVSKALADYATAAKRPAEYLTMHPIQ